jgi:hypothetical protein
MSVGEGERLNGMSGQHWRWRGGGRERKGKIDETGGKGIYNRNYDAPLRHVLSLHSQTLYYNTAQPACDTIAIRTEFWPECHRNLLQLSRHRICACLLHPSASDA